MTVRTACATALACALLGGCDTCGDAELKRAPSPDGHFIAVLMERDCGATTGWARTVALETTSDTSTVEWLRLAFRRELLVSSGQDVVDLKWSGDGELTVVHKGVLKPEQVFLRRPELAGVRSRTSPLDSPPQR